MNILLWIVQALVSLTLLWAAYTKLLTPAEQLAAMWPWTGDNPMLVKITAVFDLLGAIGLMVPKTTVYAAYGVTALMIAACGFHISRGEGSQIGINIFFLALAGFIAWGRIKKAPLS